MILDCCIHWKSNVMTHETHLTHTVLDGFPVTPGHTLVIPRRHVVTIGDLTDEEWADIRFLIGCVKRESDATSFTIGINDGPDAGRTVHHLHVHVIPRRPGDVADPRGGVRQILTGAPDRDPLFTTRETA